jgi:gliding motility-associated lipoprotein GldH
MDSVPGNVKPNYHLSIEIAHNLNYPYKNLWLSIDYLLQDSVLKQDTLECILMDAAGKWLGSGNGPTRQLSVLYKTDFVMDTAQLNQICIRHAMQDIQLNGIEKIGLKVY